MYVFMYVLTSSACTGSAMSFERMRMLRRDGYLMLGFAEIDEEDDLVCVGSTKSLYLFKKGQLRKIHNTCEL